MDDEEFKCLSKQVILIMSGRPPTVEHRLEDPSVSAARKTDLKILEDRLAVLKAQLAAASTGALRSRACGSFLFAKGWRFQFERTQPEAQPSRAAARSRPPAGHLPPAPAL